VKDSRIGHQKLLVAKSYKRSKVVYRRMWLVLENKEWNRDASGKIETKYSIRKTIATYISTNLLVLRDYDLILIVCDRFLKMLHFIVIAGKF